MQMKTKYFLRFLTFLLLLVGTTIILPSCSSEECCVKDPGLADNQVRLSYEAFSQTLAE